MRKGSRLLYVKTTNSKGKPYYYFDTGIRKPGGQPIYSRLPSLDDPSFGTAYAAAIAGRTRRANLAAILTVPGFVDLYQRSPEFRRLAASTQANYTLYTDVFARMLNSAPANEVERRDVLRLRDTYGDRHGAANGLIRSIKAVYAWGRKREHVSIEPCKGIDLFDSEDYPPWPEELLQAALASEDDSIRVPVAVMYYTAARIGDACALRWSDIRDGHVVYRQQKTKRDMKFPAHDDLQIVLAGMIRCGMTVIASDDGRPVKSEALRRRLQVFAAAAGEKIVPHGLRKNAVNSLLEVGCTAAEVSAISGQSMTMVEHYAKLRSTIKLGSAAILKWEGKR